MAFYSTFPFEHLVGPGIGRAEYGGFLMTLPPRRMYDVWSDPDYEFAQNKPERLLLAGSGLFSATLRGLRGGQAAALDFPLHRRAPEPPHRLYPDRRAFPAKLKKIRVVHVLDSYERRNEAKEYIW